MKTPGDIMKQYDAEIENLNKKIERIKKEKVLKLKENKTYWRHMGESLPKSVQRTRHFKHPKDGVRQKRRCPVLLCVGVVQNIHRHLSVVHGYKTRKERVELLDMQKKKHVAKKYKPNPPPPPEDSGAAVCAKEP